MSEIPLSTLQLKELKYQFLAKIMQGGQLANYSTTLKAWIYILPCFRKELDTGVGWTEKYKRGGEPVMCRKNDEKEDWFPVLKRFFSLCLTLTLCKRRYMMYRVVTGFFSYTFFLVHTLTLLSRPCMALDSSDALWTLFFLTQPHTL